MSIQTAHTTKPLREAVLELKGAVPPASRLVLFFASAAYDPKELSVEMQSAFPNACVVGCSTAGEITGGKMTTGSISAMAFPDDVITDVATALIEDVNKDTDVESALTGFQNHFKSSRATWDLEHYVGLVLVDGLSGAEERLMDKLGDSTDLLFVGGSAGDDLQFKATHVYAGGRASSNAAVLVLMRLQGGYNIVKTQSFRSLGKALVATKVDEARRTVVEFNHKPALDAYAEALGVAPDQAADHFFEHPLGLMVDGDPYVRSPQRVDGQTIVFYCQIKEAMELEVLKVTDIVAETRKAVEEQKRSCEGIQGLIDFQCILRTLQLRKENRCEEYAEIFDGFPIAGFSTYGEEYLGHMNQTSTMLVFHE